MKMQQILFLIAIVLFAPNMNGGVATFLAGMSLIGGVISAIAGK